MITGVKCLLEHKKMIDAYEVHSDIEEMNEMLDSLANPAYTMSKSVLGDDFVTLTDKLIKECY